MNHFYMEVEMKNHKETFRNCHRTSGKKDQTAPISDSSCDSEQDSSLSKYVVEEDHRERKDGPGGD